jgi:Raf kinase inhibitor-like YbhB/YbcL family protein
MRLRSSAFADGAAIPRRFTCEGENVSPPLEWSDVLPGTKSFAVICEDPEAPGGTFHHWAAYDIAATQSGLPLDASHQARRLGFQQATNDFERTGYSGPCPPGGTPHHYHFRLMALSVEQLSVPENSSRLPENPSCREVEREARKHVLAEATLVGIYRR